MSGKTENYIKALKASIEIQQKRLEIKRLLSEISESLTMGEVINRDFCHESAKNAWPAFEKGVIIQDSVYGEKKVLYGDISILLCCNPEKAPSTAMKAVLDQIETNDIVKAIK